MNVEIIIDETIKETTVKIFSNTYSKEVENIKNNITKIEKNVITVFEDEDILLINNEKVIRAYAENKHVYVESIEGRYKTRLKLYELEERLNKQNFIRISKSEIINLNYVKRLDLSFTGTIGVELLNGKVSYVSRRNLKEFKKAIGL